MRVCHFMNFFLNDVHLACMVLCAMCHVTFKPPNEDPLRHLACGTDTFRHQSARRPSSPAASPRSEDLGTVPDGVEWSFLAFVRVHVAVCRRVSLSPCVAMCCVSLRVLQLLLAQKVLVSDGSELSWIMHMSAGLFRASQVSFQGLFRWSLSAYSTSARSKNRHF